ncbi:MAG TPA: hypothetical protein PK020_11565 [Ilumatobacteraceae bacterium]|nr:hypothetical protein [Ilumatobacteraceae bacterium]
MMIDDRIRNAAGELRQELSGSVPPFIESRRPRLLSAAVALVVIATAGGLWASSVRDAPPEVVPLVEPDAASSSEPTVAESTVSTTTAEAAVSTTLENATSLERVTRTELDDFVGKFSIDYQPATVSLGSTGTTSWTLEMTESSFCVSFTGAACHYTDDGSPLSEEPQGMETAGGSSIGVDGKGIWRMYFIVPSGLTLQLFDDVGSACEMHQFPLEPYADADLWACENAMPEPALIDLAVIKGDRTQVATIQRPPALNMPTSDPVTTTGYRVGDTPANVDNTLPWLIVVDQTGTVVGYVKRFEYDLPSFDHVVLVYDELGARIGELGGDWQLLAPLATTTTLDP